MKILYIPRVHTSLRATSISPIAFMVDLAQKFTDKIEIDFLVPKNLVTDDINLSNVRFIKILDCFEDKWLGRFDPVITDFLRKAQSGKYDYDLVIVNAFYHFSDVNICLFERKWGGIQIRSSIPVIYFITEYNDGNIQWVEEGWVKSVVSNVVMHNISIVFTENDKKKILFDIIDIVSPSRYLKIIENVKVLKPFIFDKLLSRVKDIFERDELVFSHFGTVPPRKRIDILISSVDRAVRLGYPAKVLLVSPKKIPDEFKKNSFVDYIEDCPREDFFKHAERADIYYHGATYEGTGLSYVQCSLMGLVGLYVNTPCITDRMPKEYPFVVNENDIDSMVLMLCEIHKNKSFYPKYDFFRKQLEDFNRELFSSNNAADRFLDVFKNAIRHSAMNDKLNDSYIGKIVNDIDVRDRKDLSYNDFVNLIQMKLVNKNLELKKLIPARVFRALKNG